MIKWILLAAVGAGLYWGLSKYWTEERVKNSTPVQYTKGLQQDVQKAESVANTANQKIDQVQKAADAAMKEMDR